MRRVWLGWGLLILPVMEEQDFFSVLLVLFPHVAQFEPELAARGSSVVQSNDLCPDCGFCIRSSRQSAFTTHLYAVFTVPYLIRYPLPSFTSGTAPVPTTAAGLYCTSHKLHDEVGPRTHPTTTTVLVYCTVLLLHTQRDKNRDGTIHSTVQEDKTKPPPLFAPSTPHSMPCAISRTSKPLCLSDLTKVA